MLLCCIFSVNAFASEVTVTQQGEIQVGETLVFEVSLSEEVANVKSGSISIDYDTDKYEFSDYEWHVDEALIQTFDPRTGKGAWASISPTNVSGAIFTLKLKIKNDAVLGDASINFNVGFKDPNTNEDIKLDPINYSIFLSCENHQPGDPANCTSDQVCTVCGSVIEPAQGHNYGEWYETITPTSDMAGEKRRDCTQCDSFETEEIPAIGNIQSFIDAVANLSKNQSAAIKIGRAHV